MMKIPDRRLRNSNLAGTVPTGLSAHPLEPMRYSQLPPARQTLVRVCQNVKFGQILDLLVRKGEPTWDSFPDHPVGGEAHIEEAPRLEGDLPDFRLSSEILRLMRQLDHIKDGKVAKIEIRDGLPRRLVAHFTASVE